MTPHQSTQVNTHKVKSVFHKTEASGSLESPGTTFSQVSLEGPHQRALPVSYCCWDPTGLLSEAANRPQMLRSRSILSTWLCICWTPPCVLSVAWNIKKGVKDVMELELEVGEQVQQDWNHQKDWVGLGLGPEGADSSRYISGFTLLPSFR